VKRYLLDTSVLAAGLFGRPGAVQLLAPWIAQREAATSIVVYGETVEYLRGLPNFPARRAELRELLREVSPYFLTFTIMERYADLRRQMRPPVGGGLVGDVDYRPEVPRQQQPVALGYCVASHSATPECPPRACRSG